MRLKIGKKIRTVSHNSKFTGSYKKKECLYAHYFRPGASIAWLGGGGGGHKEILGGHENFIYVNSRVWIKRKRWRPKKRSSVQKFSQILVFIPKIVWFSTNSEAISTILRVSGLDLHSGSPEPINFFGAQFSLGGHNFRLGGHGPGMPPRGASLHYFIVECR